ncbi:hypothetical protein B0H14DRAFT_57819 [Mycena olivaceomarginata]|nr:hypothetical protein B0H14DRAFT_57819 [Mycena olivaceomarginata]
MLSNECLMGAKYLGGGGVSRVDHSGSDNEIRRRRKARSFDAHLLPRRLLRKSSPTCTLCKRHNEPRRHLLSSSTFSAPPSSRVLLPIDDANDASCCRDPSPAPKAWQRPPGCVSPALSRRAVPRRRSRVLRGVSPTPSASAPTSRCCSVYVIACVNKPLTAVRLASLMRAALWRTSPTTPLTPLCRYRIWSSSISSYASACKRSLRCTGTIYACPPRRGCRRVLYRQHTRPRSFFRGGKVWTSRYRRQCRPLPCASLPLPGAHTPARTGAPVRLWRCLRRREGKGRPGAGTRRMLARRASRLS